MRNLYYGILASGTLGSLCLEKFHKRHKINFVLTDSRSIRIIEFCKTVNIAVFVGNPRNGKAGEFINKFLTDVIFSINYIFIVEKDIINHPKKLAVNFHGSLLPKYRGRTPHVWAIINDEKETGISAHLITDECDAGDLLFQERISISSDMTGANLLSKFNKRYPVIISKVAKMIESGTINLIKQDSSKATWFGKRTPSDGMINWNWQKEQIRNWVRAQANPYPGAFSYYKHQKVTIHKVEYSDYGFHQEDENGKILDISRGIIVKSPNGAIRILDYHTEIPIDFIKGGKFDG